MRVSQSWVSSSTTRYRRFGGFNTTLGQAELRQPRLRLTSELVCPVVIFLRRHEVAQQPDGVRHLIEGRTHRGMAGMTEQQFTRTLGFIQSLSPIAAQLHQRCAMDETLSSEGDQFRMRGAPVSSRLRSIARSAPEIRGSPSKLRSRRNTRCR